MAFLNWLKNILLFNETKQENPFELLKPSSEGNVASPSADKDSASDQKMLGAKRGKRVPRKPDDKRSNTTKKGERKDSVERQQDKEPEANESQKSAVPEDMEISQRLEHNLAYLKEVFVCPLNNSIKFREFTLGLEPGINAVAIYVEGLVDAGRQTEVVFKPLMMMSNSVPLDLSGTLLTAIQKQLTPVNSIQLLNKTKDVVDLVLSGNTVLLFQGVAAALSVETTGWEHRGVEQPTIERVIRGSQEAFNEDLINNIALIRRIIRNPKLVQESLNIGRRTNNNLAVLYIHDLANQELVKEVKRRIQSLEIDGIVSMGELEQLIEDETRGVYPLSQSTERVDRVCRFLLDGKVVIFLEGDPYAAVYPSTVWGLLHTSEDYNVKPIVSTMIRGMRWLAASMVVLVPALYIAIVGYHQEMIPTDLLFSIAGSREKIPFPSVLEVFLMEISFELIREGGIRVPGLIGQTLGIVGAIILGQAAVVANIVSPIVIIVVAFTGIASYAIPVYALSTTLRVYRFGYMIVASFLGLFGIAVALATHIVAIASIKSFGVPYLSPLSPSTLRNQDVLLRGPIWDMEKRLAYVRSQDETAQPHITRKWILNPRKQGDK
ncbi:MAG: spore germination protein [Firmicutes bacterium]|nr:spore germination protein [Bacillota bacterium]